MYDKISQILSSIHPLKAFYFLFKKQTRSKQNVESRLKELKGGVKVNGISIGSVKETAL